jgi:hypothetical protein
VVSGGYTTFLSIVAGSAASLIGLLFVAISLAPQQQAGSSEAVVQEVRAAAALVAFTSAMTVAGFSLVPGTNMGYPAVVVGSTGLLFTAGSARSVLLAKLPTRRRRQQYGLLVLLTATFVTEIGEGIALLVRPHGASALERICYALVASLLVGVARSWELVGQRDTGLLHSIAVLGGRGPTTIAETSPAQPPAARPSEPPAPGPSAEVGP